MKNSRRPLIVITMALLLTVVMVMSCVTFAKYVTTDTANTDKATVAKWGWTLSADASTLFSTDYDDALVTTDDGSGTLVISTRVDTENANAPVEVVAPGTSGQMTFSIHNGDAENNSEVRTQVTFTASGAETTLTATPVAGGEAVKHLPLKWTITKDSAATTVTAGSLADVVAYLNALTATVEPNAEYAGAGDYVISWEWVDSDVYDTALGSIAAGVSADTAETTYTAELGVNFSLDITITQVQSVAP